MTVRKVRLAGTHGGAARWARGAAVALFMVIAVLVHHQTSTAMPSRSPDASRAMAAMAMPMDPIEHDAHQGAAASATIDDPTAGSPAPQPVPQADPVAYGDGKMACGGVGVEHCSASSVDSVKLAAPPAMAYAERDAAPHAAVSGRAASGTAERAPPDLLSVLSRLRI
ncbi:hypothetical protein [Streptomyces sp. 5-6(2022)]|uniref:hypothetical protein n=1 Tax=Streptomyces sp. 5-6(2022) TaxID=2936510 RepID=UPI0023B90071|nr:hypothetical protein [Streptomyces sp. 5-6(2022)]